MKQSTLKSVTPVHAVLSPIVGVSGSANNALSSELHGLGSLATAIPTITLVLKIIFKRKSTLTDPNENAGNVLALAYSYNVN